MKIICVVFLVVTLMQCDPFVSFFKDGKEKEENPFVYGKSSRIIFSSLPFTESACKLASLQ